MTDEKPEFKKSIDLNELFCFLRERYQSKTGQTSLALARTIEERPQCVSSWSTGYKRRKPPFRLIIWLASKSETKVVISDGSVSAYDNQSGDLIKTFDIQ